MSDNLTVKQAAVALGLSAQSVYALLRRRMLGHLRVGPDRGKILIPRAELDAYVNRCRVGPPAARARSAAKSHDYLGL